MIRFGMHASLWTAQWTREAAEKLVPDAAKHGLQVLEIPVLAPESIDVPHAVALLKQHGIAPTTSLCLPPEDAAPINPAGAERFLLRALETAHALGSNILGGVTYSALGWRSGSPPTDAEYANIVKALKPVARRAAELGMKVGLEPCNRYETHLLNTAEQSVRLLERIGEPNVTIHLDTYHMNIEEKGIGHGIKRAGRHCAYIHLSESDRGVPGTGTIDWNDVFRAMAESGFQGDMVIEAFITLPPEIAAALSVWRPVARDKDEVLEVGVPYLRSLARLHGLMA
ncbi:MAG: sugar phosphate isomerase/epimerase [Geminicoccaceae bacterium]